MGIFSTLTISTPGPQFSLGQLSSNMTNPTPLENASQIIIADIRDASGPFVVYDPGGDDVFSKNCVYANKYIVLLLY